MVICTIGFTGKNLREFISRLQGSGVTRVVDVRLNNTSQLAGYSKKDDLEYVLELLGITYQHFPQLGPSDELMKSFKGKQISWEQYVQEYELIMAINDPLALIDPKAAESLCLLCSEDLPTNCHRRLIAENLAGRVKEAEIRHL